MDRLCLAGQRLFGCLAAALFALAVLAVPSQSLADGPGGDPYTDCPGATTGGNNGCGIATGLGSSKCDEYNCNNTQNTCDCKYNSSNQCYCPGNPPQ